LKEDPIKLPISVKRFGDEPDIAKQVDAILNRLNDPSYTFSNYAADILYLFLKEGIFKEGVTPKLLVYCRPDSQIANVARRENPSALYGAACGSFAAVYRLDYKVTIWHEALHLLGADDCYEQDNPLESARFQNQDCFAALAMTNKRQLICLANFCIIKLIRQNAQDYIMEIEPVLKEFKEQIAELYGQRLKKVVLYGSYARGQSNDEHSDIDLAVVLAGAVDACEEIDRMADIFTDLNLEHNVLIAVYPVSESNFDTIESPFLINVRKEGITV
jgi:predicted nucleotidyltransferase